MGAIRTCSIVPRSFSRTIDSAVETTAVIIEINAISPGTRKTVLRSSGLYQTRGSTADERRLRCAAHRRRRRIRSTAPT